VILQQHILYQKLPAKTNAANSKAFLQSNRYLLS